MYPNPDSLIDYPINCTINFASSSYHQYKTLHKNTQNSTKTKALYSQNAGSVNSYGMCPKIHWIYSNNKPAVD